MQRCDLFSCIWTQLCLVAKSIGGSFLQVFVIYKSFSNTNCFWYSENLSSFIIGVLLASECIDSMNQKCIRIKSKTPSFPFLTLSINAKKITKFTKVMTFKVSNQCVMPNLALNSCESVSEFRSRPQDYYSVVSPMTSIVFSVAYLD